MRGWSKEARANEVGKQQVTSRSRAVNTRGRSHQAEAGTEQFVSGDGNNAYNHFGANGMMDQWSRNITSRWCTCKAEKRNRGRKS